jgi:Family of unknown function (DUF6496)
MPSSEVMTKWKSGQLHSGSKKGPVVHNRKQAIAIMLSEKRAEQKNGGKYPEKAVGGPMMGMPMQGVANGAMGPMGVNPGQMMPAAPAAPAPMAGPMAMAGGSGMLPTTPRALAVGGIAMPGVGNMNMAKSANLNPGKIQGAGDRQLMHGPILSAVAGRTDAHRGAVPSGSYVIPADVVSGRGQGNTIAGSNVLSRMFKMGPYGSSGGAIHPGRSMPHAFPAPKMQQIMARGGKAKDKHRHVGKPVPVNLAGGEFIVPPANLMQVVHPNLDTAHKIMDQFVLNERKKLRKTLGKLPPPIKD